MKNNPSFIIAEAGVNHNGEISLAKKLIDMASECGADAVKFQTFTAENIASKESRKAEYQEKTTGKGSQFDMLKKLELKEAEFKELAKYCQKNNIEFLSTAFDIKSADFLVSLGMKRIKIPSGEITKFKLIKHLCSYSLPLIISTGMSSLAEINNVLQFIENQTEYGLSNDSISILHCTTDYPTDPDDVNLRAINAIRKETSLNVGFSDHSLSKLTGALAVSIGANIVEKHITLSKSFEGPDHKASMEKTEFLEYVRNIRSAEKLLGMEEKKPTKSETQNIAIARRGIKATRLIKRGEKISPSNINVLRPQTGIPANEYFNILGKEVNKDIQANQDIYWEDI